MASWAGAYGAGGASDALKDIIAQRFLERRQSEAERANKTRESEDAAERTQRGQIARDELAQRASREAAAKDEAYEDRQERRRMHGDQIQQRYSDQEVRRKERADDAEAGVQSREDEQAFRADERKKDRDFQSYMENRRASREGSSDSEPLVSITDPSSGQPKLVRRSEAIGARPASTREQALTEGQSNAAGFADRMKFNESPIQAYEGNVGRLSQLQGLMPREMQSAGLQQYEAAKLNWIAAQLRKESGAAIGKDEYATADVQYFPQPGDSPQVVQQKRALRAVAEQSMRRSSGSAGTADSPPSAGGSMQASAGPAVGTRRIISGQNAQWDGQGWVAVP